MSRPRILAGLVAAVVLASLPAPAQPSISDSTPAAAATTGPLASYRIARRRSPAVLRMFGLLDANHDGRLTPRELERAARDPANAPRDFDHSGSVDEQEFMQSFLTVNQRRAATVGHLADHFVREGNSYFLLGQLGPALEIYRKMTRDYPHWGLCWLLLANALEQVGELDETRDCLVLAVDRMPTNRPSGQAPLFRLAIVEDRLGHPQRFRELVTQARAALLIEHEIFAHSMYRINARRMWETELMNLMGYLQGAGRVREAVEVAEWAASNLGLQPRLDARRLSLLAELNGPETVLPEFDRAMASGSGSEWYAVMKAGLLLRLGRLEEAIALDRKVLADSLRPEELFAARLGLYECLSRTGGGAEANQLADVLIASVAQPSGRRALLRALRRAGDRERAARVMPGAAPLGRAGVDPGREAPSRVR